MVHQRTGRWDAAGVIGGMRACGARAARSDSQVCSRRSEAAGGSGCSSGERACLGWHDREQRQLAFLLFSCRRKRCKSAPASVRSAPARRRRERRLAARSAHRGSLLAPASARGKRVMGAVDRAAARARGELRMHGGEWLTAWGALCTFETRAEAALAKLRSCGAAELVGKPAAATSQTFKTDCRECRRPGFCIHFPIRKARNLEALPRKHRDRGREPGSHSSSDPWALLEPVSVQLAPPAVSDLMAPKQHRKAPTERPPPPTYVPRGAQHATVPQRPAHPAL